VDLSERRPGPDVVRALAMLGVVAMNYHGYLILLGGRQDGDGASRRLYDLFDPWTGPLSTRFAATFVLTAGVGVTLMTRSSLGDPERIAAMRWRLARRGAVLYVFGLWFDLLWNGTILPFYGAMFLLAAVLFTLRARWVLSVGAAAAIAGWTIRWWRYEAEADGHSTQWLTRPGDWSPQKFVFDVFVNGTHPLLPWLAFFCAGIVVGRLLATGWWRRAAIGAGCLSYSAGTIVAAAGTGTRSAVVLSDDPFERGLAYTASALGTALIAFAAITWIADRYRNRTLVDWLRRAGQLSLTIYVTHALVFELLVNRLEWIEPAGIATSLGLAVCFWLPAIVAAGAYQHRFGRGPAEQIYRAITR
jgi:uncharacterized membrane protein YeiB